VVGSSLDFPGHASLGCSRGAEATGQDVIEGKDLPGTADIAGRPDEPFVGEARREALAVEVADDDDGICAAAGVCLEGSDSYSARSASVGLILAAYLAGM